MTIIEAINAIDALKPNTYPPCNKIAWLSRLDGRVKKDIIDTHEGADAVVFEGYNDDTPLDTKLLVDAPYDEVYLLWLESQIDFANKEYNNYNNAVMAYNNAYKSFCNYYNRTHMPLSAQRKYF